jgi:hypothetical protein
MSSPARRSLFRLFLFALAWVGTGNAAPAALRAEPPPVRAATRPLIPFRSEEPPAALTPAPMAAAGPISMTTSGLLQVLSPDTAQTFAGGVTVRYLLNWDRRTQELRALVAFTNSPYQDPDTPRREEQFGFRFPGVTLDPATGVFSVRDPAGNSVPVAVRVRGGGGLFSRQNAVEPTAGVSIYVSKISGRVAVRLTAKPTAPATADKSNHWVIDGQVGLL